MFVYYYIMITSTMIVMDDIITIVIVIQQRWYKGSVPIYLVGFEVNILSFFIIVTPSSPYYYMMIPRLDMYVHVRLVFFIKKLLWLVA